MYPLSSRRDKKKNRVTITGKKLSTLPTPLKIPSITREWSTSFTFQAVSSWSTAFVRLVIPISRRSESPFPITPKVSQKTRAIIPAKHGMAVYLPVSILSIFWLRRCSLLSWGLTTVSSQTFSIKSKRMCAMAAERSRPLSASICFTICSKVSFSFWSSFSFSRISSSPSASLLAAKRTGMSAFWAWSSIRCIIPWRHLWTAPPSSLASQKSSRLGRSWYFATWMAWATSSSIPSFFAAEIGTTGIPRSSSIWFTKTAPPFCLTSSIIFSASTMGTSSSISCMVR